MIQTATLLPQAAASGLAPGIAATANGPENADFSAILSVISDGNAPQGAEDVAVAGRQDAAGIDPAGGKILPGAVLVLAATTDAVVAEDSLPHEVQPGSARHLRLPQPPHGLAELPAGARAMRLPFASPPAPTHEDGDTADTSTEAEGALPPLPVTDFAIVGQPGEAPLPGGPASAAAPDAERPAPNGAPPPEGHARPGRAPGAVAAIVVPLAHARGQADTVDLNPRDAQSAPGAQAVHVLSATQLRPDLGAAAPATWDDSAQTRPAGPALTLRAPIAEANPKASTDALALVAAEDLSAFAPGTSQVTSPAAPAGGPGPTTAPTPAPHDFATLVDRLIEAREAARPHGVNVAVQHAEFGKIALHFRQDDAGLSVTAQSADPDFARAFQAAVPPAAPADSGTTAGNGTGAFTGWSARQDGPAAQAGGQNGQPGGEPRQSSSDRDGTRKGAAAGGSSETPEAPAARRDRFA